MEPILGVLIGSALGGVLNGFGGAALGAVVGYLFVRVLKLEQSLQDLNERFKALHVLFEEGRYGERIRLLQQRLARLEGVQAITGAVPQQASSPLDISTAAPNPEPVDQVAPVDQSPALDVRLDEAESTLSAVEAARPAWLVRLLSGNPLAKVGAALLFFGIASGFKLAVDHGLFPLSLRVLLTACVAFTMLVFGWQQRAERPLFSEALQGSGFAILYLIVFFMLSRWGWISPGLAFAVFVALAGICITLSLLQSTQTLAIFGSAGGFLAPILASTGHGSHVLLFSFYLLLGVTLLAASAWRGWRALPISGMVFTFAVGLSWALQKYTPVDYHSTQPFLMAFFLLYGLWPLWVTRRYLLVALDSPLTFGAPLAALALQYGLMLPWQYGFAISAALAGIFYLLLCYGVRARRDWLPAAFFGLGVALLTLAVPFAFDAVPSAGLWAAEGAAGLAVALRHRSRLGLLAGLFLQLLAGVYFLAGMNEVATLKPVINGVFLTGALLALAGGVSAWLLVRSDKPLVVQQKWLSTVWLVWALLWWFAVSWREIDDFAQGTQAQYTMGLLHWAGTVLLLDWLGGRLAWAKLRRAVAALNLLLVPALMLVLLEFSHIFSDRLGWVCGVTLGVAWWVRWRQDAEEEGEPVFSHLLLSGLTLLSLINEVLWRSEVWLPTHDDRHYLFVLPLLALALLFCRKWPYWPVADWPEIYAHKMAAPIALPALLLSVWLNLTMDGVIGSFGYFPLFSLFDIFNLFVIYTAWCWAQEEDGGLAPRLVQATGFAWLTLLPARAASAWFGVSFGVDALFYAPEAATGLALVWTALSLALMWRAQRLASRPAWFAGFGLLAVVGVKLLLVDLRNVNTMAWTVSLIGVALLVLAASYIAPTPPRQDDGLNE